MSVNLGAEKKIFVNTENFRERKQPIRGFRQYVPNERREGEGKVKVFFIRSFSSMKEKTPHEGKSVTNLRMIFPLRRFCKKNLRMFEHLQTFSEIFLQIFIPSNVTLQKEVNSRFDKNRILKVPEFLSKRLLTSFCHSHSK
jgi:hypothetical protein